MYRGVSCMNGRTVGIALSGLEVGVLLLIYLHYQFDQSGTCKACIQIRVLRMYRNVSGGIVYEL